MLRYVIRDLAEQISQRKGMKECDQSSTDNVGIYAWYTD